MIFNLNFYVLMASDAFYGFPGSSRLVRGAGGPCSGSIKLKKQINWETTPHHTTTPHEQR